MVPPPHVHHHVAGRRSDRQARPIGGGQRFWDQIGSSCPGLHGSVVHGPLFDAGDPARGADHHLGAKKRAQKRVGISRHCLDQIAQHRFGDHKIGDHPVPDRASHFDALWGPSEHVVRFVPDSHHRVVAQPNCHHGRLVQHNAPSFDVDQDVDRPQIDADMLSKHQFT